MILSIFDTSYKLSIQKFVVTLLTMKKCNILFIERLDNKQKIIDIIQFVKINVAKTHRKNINIMMANIDIYSTIFDNKLTKKKLLQMLKIFNGEMTSWNCNSKIINNFYKQLKYKTEIKKIDDFVFQTCNQSKSLANKLLTDLKLHPPSKLKYETQSLQKKKNSSFSFKNFFSSLHPGNNPSMRSSNKSRELDTQPNKIIKNVIFVLFDTINNSTKKHTFFKKKSNATFIKENKKIGGLTTFFQQNTLNPSCNNKKLQKQYNKKMTDIILVTKKY